MSLEEEKTPVTGPSSSTNNIVMIESLKELGKICADLTLPSGARKMKKTPARRFVEYINECKEQYQKAPEEKKQGVFDALFSDIVKIFTVLYKENREDILEGEDRWLSGNYASADMKKKTIPNIKISDEVSISLSTVYKKLEENQKDEIFAIIYTIFTTLDITDEDRKELNLFLQADEEAGTSAGGDVGKILTNTFSKAETLVREDGTVDWAASGSVLKSISEDGMMKKSLVNIASKFQKSGFRDFIKSIQGGMKK